MARPKSEGIRVHGFTRVRLTEDSGEPGSKIVGESDWDQNVVVNDGFDAYLCKNLAGTSGSQQVGFIALGTGTKPGAAHQSLDGEIMGSTKRKAPTVSVTSSKTLRFTATFYSSDSFLTGASNLQNVGLFEASAANSLFAGNTYASSSCNTNQNVNVTYDIQFS
jgi:hypothetical protein